MTTILLDIALKAVLISLCGLVAVKLLRRSSAATRHLVLTLTMAGLLVLPVVSILAPRWQVPFFQVTVSAPVPPAANPVAAEAIPSAVAPATQAATSSIPSAALLWGAIAGLLGLRVLLRFARLRDMERRIPMSAQPTLQATVTEHCRRSRKHVLLLEGGAGEPPMTWGHFRPVLLLPSEAGEWPSERLDSVVLHELAHVERADWLASVIAQMTCAFYWFNPFVWVIASQMAKESESAADDRVLGCGLPATQYASHLLEVLRDLRKTNPASNSALAMARPGILDGRVQAILEDRRCRRPVQGRAALALVAGLGVAVIVIGAAGPTVLQQTTPPERTPNFALHPGDDPKPDWALNNLAKARLSEKLEKDPVEPKKSNSSIKTRRTSTQNSVVTIGRGEEKVTMDPEVFGKAMASIGQQAVSESLDQAHAEMKKGFEDARREIAENKDMDEATRKIAENALKLSEAATGAALQVSITKGLEQARSGIKKGLEDVRRDVANMPSGKSKPDKADQKDKPPPKSGL